MRVMALDYGRARTGVAVSDVTGTLARPLCTVARAASEQGLAELSAIIEREGPELIVVGMPVTLRGEHGAQAEETAAFVALLRERCTIPITTEDERFTTSIARQRSSPSRRSRPDDPAAAAVLLQGVLDRLAAARAPDV